MSWQVMPAAPNGSHAVLQSSAKAAQAVLVALVVVLGGRDGQACSTHEVYFRVAECVLVYMDPGESAALVRWLGGYLSTAEFVTYEQVAMHAHPRSAVQISLVC